LWVISVKDFQSKIDKAKIKSIYMNEKGFWEKYIIFNFQFSFVSKPTKNRFFYYRAVKNQLQLAAQSYAIDYKSF